MAQFSSALARCSSAIRSSTFRLLLTVLSAYLFDEAAVNIEKCARGTQSQNMKIFHSAAKERAWHNNALQIATTSRKTVTTMSPTSEFVANVNNRQRDKTPD